MSGSAAMLAALGWSAAILASRTPPNCISPRTLARARGELGRLLAPIPAPDLVRIRTEAGSAWAVRFVCTAEFADPDQIRLPNGVLIRSVRYTSILSGPARTQKVSIKLEPVLQWQMVQ